MKSSFVLTHRHCFKHFLKLYFVSISFFYRDHERNFANGVLVSFTISGNRKKVIQNNFVIVKSNKEHLSHDLEPFFSAYPCHSGVYFCFQPFSR